MPQDGLDIWGYLGSAAPSVIQNGHLFSGQSFRNGVDGVIEPENQPAEGNQMVNWVGILDGNKSRRHRDSITFHT